MACCTTNIRADGVYIVFKKHYQDDKTPMRANVRTDICNKKSRSSLKAPVYTQNTSTHLATSQLASSIQRCDSLCCRPGSPVIRVCYLGDPDLARWQNR